MKQLKLFILLLYLSITISAQVSTQNYISTRTMLKDDGSSYINNTTYYDGLGRPFQTMKKTTNSKDSCLITLQEYDLAGRNSNGWLPVVIKDDYIAPASFKSLAPGKNFNDSRPYNEPVYEASPLNRITKQYGPGAAWYNGHPVSQEYLTNVNDVNSELNCINYSASASYSLTKNDSYNTGQLYVIKSTDEDKNVSYTFTDKLGRTLLERMMKGSEAHDTYYVYDERNNLCFVLPPAINKDISATKLALYAYQYKYDGRNRCEWKKLPGVEPIQYVYDDADRLTYSQDGNQATAKWTFYLYDNLSRLIQQGECTGKNTASSPVVHIQYYYDSYNFVGQAGFTDSAYSFTNEQKNNGKGYLTGNVITVLGDSRKIYVANYYDIKGRITKIVQNNLLDGLDITETSYTFTGNPSAVAYRHTYLESGSRKEIKENYTYSYDDNDRLTKAMYALNGSVTLVVLFENTYNNLGQMTSKSLHATNANKTIYKYNLRGFLKSIDNPAVFTQTLYYQDKRTNNTNTACYNGNMSGMDWKVSTTSDNVQRGYDYIYDGLSRLTQAYYLQSNVRNTNFNTSYAYDKNGNIIGLQRNGQTGVSTFGTIDNLTLLANGNMLTRVNDAATASAYNGGFEFKNGKNEDNEYAYDKNGNLIKDSNKDIKSIQYNILNLPSLVTFGDENTITYTYGADGTKLRTVHKIGGITTTTNYCANVIYESGKPKLVLTDVGYISDPATTAKYHYYLQDHQGNNRVVIDQSGKVEEINHYYPFGGTFATSTAAHPYKYNGKEYDAKKGLNWYDYGARQYDAALGRFMTVDPLAEKYNSVSSYTYCLNNPANRIDPTGMASYYNWDNQRYEDEEGNEVSWESVKREYGFRQANLPGDPPTASDVDGVTGAAPRASQFTKEKLVEFQKSNSLVLPVPQSVLLIKLIESLISSPSAIFLSIPILLQGDDSPEHVKQAGNSSKNEKHGDDGRALEKDKERIGELEKALQKGSKKEREQIKNKIKHIRENGQKNKRGEEHSRQNKR